MIVLAAVDAITRSAALREVEIAGSVRERDVADVQTRVRALGIHDIVLGHDDVLATAAPLDHRWVFYDDCMHYEARFAHGHRAAAQVAFYSAVALAVAGPSAPNDIAQVRMGITELARHAVGHGRPRGVLPQLTVGFRFGPDEVRGWVHDQCEAHDPLRVELDLRNKAASARVGDEVGIARRLLDTLEYEYLEGNRVSFRRRHHA